MNKERIEGLSINYLKNILLKTGYITPYVSENDKTPSWDGCVILRNKRDSASKENLRRVFVQVKGKEVAPPYQSQISFQSTFCNNPATIILLLLYSSSFTYG